MPLPSPPSSRRGFLTALSAGIAGLLPGAGARAAAPAGGGPDSDGAHCVLTPQSIEGPFYLDPKLVRADITDGRAGVPLRLRLRVVEAGPCTPIAGARVDVWHCDAKGLYSGYPGQGDARSLDTSGKTFLRGTQMTDAAGWVGFETIYPGWYVGRATHIHVRTILDARTVLIGQIYFPDALNEFLYTNVPAYAGRKADRFIINANDGILHEEDPERRAFCAVKEERDRYVATLTLGVDRGANAASEARDETPSGRPERPLPPDGPPPDFRRPPRLTMKERLAALVPGFQRER